MTDQTFEEKVQKIAAEMRDAMRREDDGYPYAEFLSDMGDYIKDLESLLPAPTRPTLADMTDEERRACQWMLADVGDRDTRAVIINPHWGYESARVLWPGAFVQEIGWEWVTPRPDLPRMEWPGDKKPASALPDGFRLADHKDHGRVMVTTPTPNIEGSIYYVLPVGRNLMGFDWRSCDPDMLTYLDQEADTSDAAPPNTLAVGSEWNYADALTRACRESGHDQIIALDRDGDAYVWDEMAEWWADSHPLAKFAPYTIIHEGKKADQ